MKNIKTLFLAIMSLQMLTLSSCGDSFFELEPHNQVTVNGMYKTVADYRTAVNGCYAKLQSQVNFYIEMCEYRSDNLSISAPTSGTQDRYDIDRFQDVASNGILLTYWSNFDNGVYRCNLLLDRIDDATIDNQLKAQFKGEALFIRALTYFNMYRCWGGVPATSHVVTPNEALSIPRSSETEMYSFISGDLKNIIENNLLPEQYTSSDDAGRATLGAAKTLLAKVDLTFGYDAEATELLASLIDKYTLLDNPADVFSVDNKLNDEIIFAIQFDKSIQGEGHSQWCGITNETDNTGQSNTLKNLYSANDKRANLIQYRKVEGRNLYLPGKFYDTPDPVNNTYGNDYILLRYPDVLLMYAEALNNQSYNASQSSQALISLNKVRTRAGLTALTSDDVPDKFSFKRAILDERQREFPYEGQRWFDLVRMGYAKEVMAAEGFSITDNQLLYAIPTEEMERIGNDQILWQNPGY